MPSHQSLSQFLSPNKFSVAVMVRLSDKERLQKRELQCVWSRAAKHTGKLDRNDGLETGVPGLQLLSPLLLAVLMLMTAMLGCGWFGLWPSFIAQFNASRTILTVPLARSSNSSSSSSGSGGGPPTVTGSQASLS